MASQQDEDYRVMDLSAGVGHSQGLPPINDSRAWDKIDQETARKVAYEDLNRKNKQTHRGLSLLWLIFQSTGVIYGDIGTSPLYVYSSTFSSHPSKDDTVGTLSIIIWSLTLIVTVKYCFIVLSADDDGQGGTFALYSLLARHANIVRRDPNVSNMVRIERHLTRDMPPAGKTARSIIERSKIAKIALKMIGVIGISMVVADSVLMPAQSVLGAIQGIRVVRPDLGTSAIVGISCAIIVMLFFIQSLGTSKIGTCFAPIVVAWLLFNLSSGIYNLAKHDHTVLRAFSPYFAFAYLIRNGTGGWKSLGGLLLAFTGVESLFADMGAFGKRAIQLSWLFLAYPCLLMTYIGQAAFISDDGSQTAYANPFFYSVPPGTFYFSLVIAILAASVGSQALITSSFQLLSQAMRLSYFPHIKMIHTSRAFHYQVYIPFANFLLMVGSIIVTAVYNNTTSLGHAYGVCVAIVAFITTCMTTIVALIIWRTSAFIIVPSFLIFIALDGAYMSAALQKVPAGGWFTLVLAFILSLIFTLWRWGKEKQWAAETQDRTVLMEVLDLSKRETLTEREHIRNETQFVLSVGGDSISLSPGLGVFFDKVGSTGDKIPQVFTQFMRHFKSRPEVVVLFHMRPLSQPTVPDDERFIITRVSDRIPSCYRITLRHGYADDVLTPDLGPLIVRELILFITKGAPEIAVHDMPPQATMEMETLHRGQEAQILYIMGKQVMRIRKRDRRNPLRRMALEVFLWIRENSRRKLADLNVDPECLVEVGFVKAI